MFYVGTMAVSSALLGADGRGSSAAHRSIRDTDDRPDPAPSLATVVGFVLALAISLIFPATSYFPLLLLLLSGPATRGVRRARGGGPRTTPMGE